MATSGTTLFNLDMGDLIEEAFERCGTQSRSGYDFRTAARSVNMLTIEWANRGINLWTIEQGQIPININGGQISYPIPCLLYTSPSPRDGLLSRMPSSA